MENSRKIIEDALEGRRPERAPIFDLLCNDAIIEYFAGHRLDGIDDRQTVYSAVGKAMDGCPLIFFPDREGRTWIDEVGNVHIASRWTEWVSKRAMTTEEQWTSWSRQNIERLESETEPANEDLIKVKQEQLSINSRLNSSVLAHPYASTSWNHALFYYHCGLDCFSLMMYSYPELTRRWMGAIAGAQLRQLKLKAHQETSPLGMIWSDIGFKTGLMASRNSLSKLGLFEEVSEICQIFHERRLKAIFHSDGNINEVLDDLIAAGIDGLNPVEKTAGMDIFEIRRKYPRLILVGGIDTNTLLSQGTPEQVRQEVRHIINEVGYEGRLLLGGTAGELDNTIPLENYLAMYEEASKG